MLARRMARAITGAATLAKPAGSPRLRSVIRIGATGVLERVGRLRGERSVGGAHDEPFAGYELAHLRHVLQPPPEEPGYEGKGQQVAVPGYDVMALNTLTPHPVYAWMRWAQILSPTRDGIRRARTVLDESLGMVREKWRRRVASAGI